MLNGYRNMQENSTGSDVRKINSGSRWMGGFLEEVSLCKKISFPVSCFSLIKSDRTDCRHWWSGGLVHSMHSPRGGSVSLGAFSTGRPCLPGGENWFVCMCMWNYSFYV